MQIRAGSGRWSWLGGWVTVLVVVQEAGDLSLHRARLQPVTDGAGGVKQILLQLGRKGVPLHDNRGSEATKNLLLVFRRGRALAGAFGRRRGRKFVLAAILVCAVH